MAFLIESDEWNRQSHPMKKDSFGVWEIAISPISPGVCAIPHDSKIKVIQVFIVELFS